MKRSRSVGSLGLFLGLSWAAIALAQQPGSPLVMRPHRLGLVDSRPVEIELIPGVRLWGLEVLGVVPGSPAMRAGLKPGDVILAANSRRVDDPDDLRRVLAESGGLLRLKVFEARSEQVLNVPVVLEPPGPGPGPVPITVTGRLKVGVMAIGGETTGITLTAEDGRAFDLDFGAGRPPGREVDGRLAFVSGWLKPGPGPERPGRRVIRVEDFRLIGGRPRPEGDASRIPF
jgi:membrane-associated protease RseP (regulator of RpoE activity)